MEQGNSQGPYLEGSLAADFSCQNGRKAVICAQSECEQTYFPPGTPLYYIHSNDREVEGCFVCESCQNYYLGKTGTRRRDDPRHLQSGSSRGNDQISAVNPAQNAANIHREIALAQRGSQTLLSSQLSDDIDNISPIDSRAAVQPLGIALRGLASVQVPAVRVTPGPVIVMPGAGVMAPPLLTHPVPFGYTMNHLLYNDQHKQVQQKAYASSIELIVVRISLVIMPAGKIKHQLVGDLHNTISDVDVHISTTALKMKCFQLLYMRWLKYSCRFTLNPGDLILHDKDWEKLELLIPDENVIARDFFKPDKKGVIKFHAGRGVHILLHIPNDVYRKYLMHEEEIEMGFLTGAEKQQKKEKAESMRGSGPVNQAECAVPRVTSQPHGIDVPAGAVNSLSTAGASTEILPTDHGSGDLE
ncbi:hypothetical protein SCP_1800830 [Sparassis crispa]|uniref:Uncharacterized protein n=1 Tax=Sparassis crispa TaxID=139825 RepID=A0A401H6P4_9APHY|nr:hypothetical protein SCP_1800830 [Sparassis crispa]GBE90061.1 hypothetical protein SCP_1800830 [Sparassis crispa]